MADYMREIIYLKKVKEGTTAQNGGFVRLNKKGKRVTVCFSVKGREAGFRGAVYLIYEKNGVLCPFAVGESDGEGTIEITVEAGQTSIGEGEICGILIGRQACYWVGCCEKYGKEIFYEQIDFSTVKPAEKKNRTKAEIKEPEQNNEPEQSREEKAQAASLDGLPGQEPEKQRDPFLAKLSEMYPFEDDEMEWCLQMEPTDFTSFPMEFWHYARNSFLLQGFYNYRHLLYVHGKDKNYIGVPGQFHRREQYLANRFGFPRFKGTQKKRVTVGDFGYWLKEL